MNKALVNAAKRCLDNLGTYVLDMGSFYEDTSCGTSFCMLGDLYAEDHPNTPTAEAGQYIIYSSTTIGLRFMSREWEWLFDSYWPNDLDQAKARCNYVIIHGAAPEEFMQTNEQDDYYLPFLTPGFIVEYS